MRNIFLLTKNYFNCAIGTLRGKKNRFKGIAGMLLIALLMGGIFALIMFQGWSLVTLYSEAEAQTGFGFMKLVINQGFTMGGFIAIFFAMQKVTGGQRANDADLLLSMPVRRYEIVTAKALAKYFFNLSVVFMFAGPFVLAYLVFYQFSLTVLLGSAVAMLFVPFFAVGLSYILDYITTVLFSKSVAGNILKAIITLAAIVAFVFLYTSSAATFEGTSQDEFIAKIPPIMWMVNIAFSFDVVSLLLLAALAFVPFTLGMIMFATTFDKQNQVAKQRKVDIAAQPNRGQVMSIFGKELNKFVNTPIWIINSLMGMIMLVGFTVWMIADGSMLTNLAAATAGSGDISSSITFMLAFVLCVLTAMSYTSCCSISLEGRYMWILKTMPIDTRAVLWGKSLLNIVLVVPVVILCSTVLSLLFALSIEQFVILTLCPILMNLFITFAGLFINLLYPKLDWDSEGSVVKQSLSVVITTFLGTGISLVAVVPVIIAGAQIIPYMGWIMLAGYALIAAVAAALVFTKGKTLFEKL